MALGGRAAEAVVFRCITTGKLVVMATMTVLIHHTTGAEDDLRRVTEMARRQVDAFIIISN